MASARSSRCAHASILQYLNVDRLMYTGSALRILVSYLVIQRKECWYVLGPRMILNLSVRSRDEASSHFGVKSEISIHATHKRIPPCASRWSLQTLITDHTSWFKLKDPNFVSHECRLQYLIEGHIYRIILTSMNCGRG